MVVAGRFGLCIVFVCSIQQTYSSVCVFVLLPLPLPHLSILVFLLAAACAPLSPSLPAWWLKRSIHLPPPSPALPSHCLPRKRLTWADMPLVCMAARSVCACTCFHFLERTRTAAFCTALAPLLFLACC